MLFCISLYFGIFFAPLTIHGIRLTFRHYSRAFSPTDNLLCMRTKYLCPAFWKQCVYRAHWKGKNLVIGTVTIQRSRQFSLIM